MTIWNEALARIEKQLSRPSFATWLENTSLLSIDEETNTLVIQAPNEFACDWLETRYSPIIQDTLQEITGERYALRFVAKAGAAEGAAVEISERSSSAKLDDDMQRKVYDAIMQLQEQVSSMETELNELRKEIRELRDQTRQNAETEVL
jgi:chromosomal replication initiation ATPase DnaA